MSDDGQTVATRGGIPNPFWNPRERRLRAVWRLLLQILLVLLLGLVLQTAAILLLISLQGGIGASDQLLMNSPWLMLVGTGTTLLAVVLSMAIAAPFLDRRPFSDYGLHFGVGWWVDLSFGLALGALLMTLVFLIEWLGGWVTIRGTINTGNGGLDFAPAIIVALASFVFVGIYEEMFVRGYLLRNLAEGFNLPFLGSRVALLLALALSSILFGVLHAANPNATALSSFNLVLIGLFLGWGYVLTGELAIPIGIHIAWNFFQGNVFGFPVSGGFGGASFVALEQRGPELFTGGAFGPEAGLLGLLVSLLGALLVWLWVRRRYGSARLRTGLAEYERRPSRQDS